MTSKTVAWAERILQRAVSWIEIKNVGAPSAKGEAIAQEMRNWLAAPADETELDPRPSHASGEREMSSADERVKELEAAIKDMDLQAEVGLCTYSQLGMRERFGLIRRAAHEVGLQGGVTEFKPS